MLNEGGGGDRGVHISTMGADPFISLSVYQNDKMSNKIRICIITCMIYGNKEILDLDLRLKSNPDQTLWITVSGSNLF